jgi:hypothetical protein
MEGNWKTPFDSKFGVSSCGAKLEKKGNFWVNMVENGEKWSKVGN